MINQASAGVDREMSLYEIAVVTRANPARTIGMAYRKGHLGLGADGDVTVYDIDPGKLNVNDSTISSQGSPGRTIR